MFRSMFVCSQPAEVDMVATGQYVKASKRLSLNNINISAPVPMGPTASFPTTVIPTTPIPTPATVNEKEVEKKEKGLGKKKKSRLQRASITISSPSGFRHEFHLGRDVESMSELWDLERWRTEIEHRVQLAAAEHAAMNHHNSEEEERKLRRTRTTCSIRRKPVPRLDADDTFSPSSSPTPPPLPSSTAHTHTRVHENSNSSSESLLGGLASSSGSDHSGERDETSSIASSLPPSTPPTRSPRVSSDLKFVDHPDIPMPPMIEEREEEDFPNPFRSEGEGDVEGEDVIEEINEILASYDLREAITVGEGDRTGQQAYAI